MAKKKRIVDDDQNQVLPPIFPGASAPDETSYEFVDASELPQEIQALAKEYSSEDFEIKIQRKNPKTGLRENVPVTCNAVEFNPNQIALDWGGGRYYFKILDPQKKIVKQFSSMFAERQTPAVAPGSDTSTRVLEAMKEERQSAKEQAAKNESNMFEMMKLVIQSVTARPAVNTLDELVKYKSLLGLDKKDDGDPFEKMLSAVQLGKELGSMEAGGQTELDSILKVIKTLAPGSTDALIAKLLNGKGAPAPVQEPPAAPAYVPPAPGPVYKPPEIIEAEDVDMTVEEFIIQTIKKNQRMFYGFAKSNTPPSIVSSMLLAQMDDRDGTELAAYLKENGVGFIISQFPDFSLYETWLKELAEVVINNAEPEPVVNVPGPDKPPTAEVNPSMGAAGK